ncbi:ribonuclease E inhibitor RraB [Brucella pituitosa]|uniref:ribonuclease E inhibitor RraB n=1 Tax=Brucella pituitosa TaxID=571256 RepID=UPI000CFF23CF|nr:hypothetical protein CQ062_09540 [Ochrobactrum sp. MYb68]
MLQLVLIGLIIGSAIDAVKVDEAIISEHRMSDADVLASLHRNGNCSSVVRTIDLRFVGVEPSVIALTSNAPNLGFTFMQTADMQDDEVAVDFTIEADTYSKTIDNLTLKALKIEQYYSVRYDGWGTKHSDGMRLSFP